MNEGLLTILPAAKIFDSVLKSANTDSGSYQGYRFTDTISLSKPDAPLEVGSQPVRRVSSKISSSALANLLVRCRTSGEAVSSLRFSR